jgi:hypothetical protein
MAISATASVANFVSLSKTNFRLLVVSFTFLLCSCASNTDNYKSSDEDKLLKAWTVSDAVFKGTESTFSFRATLMSEEATRAILDKQNSFYQWDEVQRAKAEATLATIQATQSQVFLSFFTPESRDDNMHEKNSIWKVYLKLQGVRHEGKIEKDKREFTELVGLFPYHTRWNTAYMVTFPVPTSALVNSEIQLTLTGPLGNKTVEFKH